VDEIRKITTELAKIEEGKVKAIAEGDKVYLMIQDAPAELRRLADALEKIDVREIKALVAYAKPGGPAGGEKKLSARAQKILEAQARSPVEARAEECLSKIKARLKKAGASEVKVSSVKDGVARLSIKGEEPDLEQIRDDAEEAFEKDLPEIKRVEVEGG
jgi:hypothetical protein